MRFALTPSGILSSSPALVARRTPPLLLIRLDVHERYETTISLVSSACARARTLPDFVGFEIGGQGRNRTEHGKSLRQPVGTPSFRAGHADFQ